MGATTCKRRSRAPSPSQPFHTQLIFTYNRGHIFRDQRMLPTERLIKRLPKAGSFFVYPRTFSLKQCQCRPIASGFHHRKCIICYSHAAPLSPASRRSMLQDAAHQQACYLQTVPPERESLGVERKGLCCRSLQCGMRSTTPEVTQ